MCVAFKFNLINRLIYKKWPYPKLFLSFILDLNLKSFQLPGPLKLEKLMMAFTPWRLPRHCDLSFDLSRYYLSLRFGPGLPNVYPSSRLRGQDIRPRSSLLPQLEFDNATVWDDQNWELLRIRLYKRMFWPAQLFHSVRCYFWNVQNRLFRQNDTYLYALWKIVYWEA